MKTGLIFLGLTLSAITVALIMYFIRVNRSNSPPPTPSKSKKKLFLLPEFWGFLDKEGPLCENNIRKIEIPHFGNRFDTVAVMYLDKPNKPENKNSLSDIWNAAKNLIHVNNSNFNSFELWIQFDVELSDSMPTVTNCKKNVNDCFNAMETAYNNYNKQIRVSGIYFDYEDVVNLSVITEAMEKLATKYNLQLAFSRSISDCKKRTFGQSQKEWDYCLGQTYTDETLDMYLGVDCGQIDLTKVKKAWRLGIKDDGYSTPLFCGAGNCQELCCVPYDLTNNSCTNKYWSNCNYTKDKNNNKKCTDPGPKRDERLNVKTISEIFNDGDIESSYPNLGLWYGFNSDNKQPCLKGACGKKI